MKEKIKLKVLNQVKFLSQVKLIILFQNISFSKEFLAYTDCLGIFTKINKGSGTSF